MNMMIARIAIAGLVALLGIVPGALADAGAPDPSFGRDGIVMLAGTSKLATTSTVGTGLMLPDGSIVVPRFRTDYHVKRGTQVGIRRRALSLAWIDTRGRTVRTSAPIALPKDLSEERLERAPDGHLFLIGARPRTKRASGALHVVRLTSDGVPAAAPGAASATTIIPLRAIANLSTATNTSTVISDIEVTPEGRLLVLFSQWRSRGYQTVANGPLVATLVDPAAGIMPGYAGGGLVVAPATDQRTTSSASMALDATGRMLVLVRTSKQAIAGSAQDVRLARYDVNGAVDPTFAGGSIDIDGGSIDTAYSGAPSIAVLRNGDILTRLDVAIERGASVTRAMELARFHPDGQPAAAFGAAGRAAIKTGSTPSRFGAPSDGPSGGGGGVLLEQPDGKLIVGASRDYPSGQTGEVMRVTSAGALDTAYEQHGYARFDVPSAAHARPVPIGIDPEGRAVASVASYSYDGSSAPSWLVRLLGGDQPAPPASIAMRVDNRASCGASLRRACFDADGSVYVTGKLVAGGRGVRGATVVVSLGRPSSSSVSGPRETLPPVRTGADGRFRALVHARDVLPGAWAATARVVATRASQRIDTSRAVHMTLGPRADIAMLRTIQRAQALNTVIDYVVSDTIDTDREGNATKQCVSIAVCFRPSLQLEALVSRTMRPAPGKAGLILRKPEHYTIVTRVDTAEFHLEFVLTQTTDDIVSTCRGDAAARKRWCEDNDWADYSDDPFVTAGVDGAPFDY